MTRKLTGTYRGITYNRAKLGALSRCISEKQVQNLIDLADVLRNIPPPIFEMKVFGAIIKPEKLPEKLLPRFSIGSWDMGPWFYREVALAGESVAHDCGTSCCAIGTAAFHGIGVISNEDNDWHKYSLTNFGVTDSSWEWCFSGDWTKIDNQATGAAARILYMLVHGLKDIANPYYPRPAYVPAYMHMADVEILPKE